MSIKKQIKSEEELLTSNIGFATLDGFLTWDNQFIHMKEFDKVIDVDEEIRESYRYIDVKSKLRYREAWLKEIQ